MAHKTHDPFRVAVAQLEAALRLYFAQNGASERDGYYAVITLAGASEEILGRMLKERDGHNSLDSLRRACSELSLRLLGKAPDERKIVDTANRARNSLKHWHPHGALTFDARDEANAMLDRAVDNYFGLTTDLTDAMRRFQDMHVGDNRQIRP